MRSRPPPLLKLPLLVLNVIFHIVFFSTKVAGDFVPGVLVSMPSIAFEGSVVTVVRAHAFGGSVAIDYLLSDETLIGARYSEPALARAPAFAGMAMMQLPFFSSSFTRLPPPSSSAWRSLHLGLGVGTLADAGRREYSSNDADCSDGSSNAGLNANHHITDADVAIAELFECGLLLKMIGARQSIEGAANAEAYLFQLAGLRNQLVLRWSDIRSRQVVGCVA